ncbi:uncharacterized protein LOC122511807 [Leptopilina heterotoma]|uniref:uncharacterized protein LOC122511807 n=1 Tax=Leptopilina heterotoma TaxID=63436 RepID=UPI001CA7F0B4|nr:uncharacterized protein LOC122511807 [Leptopilina heterotoma]
MTKMWLLLFFIIVHNAVSLDVYLARMILISDNTNFNEYSRVKKTDGTVGAKIKDSDDCRCDKSAKTTQTLGGGTREGRFTFGENLNFKWINSLRLYEQHKLNGRMTITYENNKHKKTETAFTLCKPIYKRIDPKTAESAFARDLFFKIFIKKYLSWECIDPMDVRVDDTYFFEYDQKNFIHCDALATITFELKAEYSADCGIGGSGESFNLDTLRVFFNTKFYDCDGTKYLPFADFDPNMLTMAKLAQAKNFTEHLAKLPLNL